MRSPDPCPSLPFGAPARGRRGPRPGAAVARIGTGLVAVLLVGCANLDAVREFAGAAAPIAGASRVTEAYLDAPSRLLATMPPGDEQAADRARLERSLRSGAETAQRRRALLAVHAAASGYMAALAELAGDKTYDVGKEAAALGAGLGDAAQAVPGLVTASQAAAVKTLVERLADAAMAWRQQRDVRAVVHANAEPMAQTLDALVTIADATVGVLKNGEGTLRDSREQMLRQWPEAAAAQDAKVWFLRRRAIDFYDAEQHARRADLRAAEALATGARKVREGHAAMVASVDRLDAAALGATLAALTKDLRAVHVALQAF